jgi:NADH-quinone oxidoreductase subunit E
MKSEVREVFKIVKKYQSSRTALIAVLQDIQEKYNWLPPDALKCVSQELDVPLIDVYSVATFYRAFSLTPRGKHLVTVCLGTACHVRGAPGVLDRITERLKIESGCTTPDGQFTLETVNCLGACALAPIVVVDGKYYGKTTVKKTNTILDKYKNKKRRRVSRKRTK